MNKLVVVVLAAGKGTRMKSDLSKVCHKVGSKTMIEHVVDAASMVCPRDIVVVVSKDNIGDIKKSLTNRRVRFKLQLEQLGTGHAVLSAVPCCNDSNDLLVLLGDVPLIHPKTLNKIVSTNYDAVVVGFNETKDNKFGRIIIENDKVTKIVEYLDATEEERLVKLCNSGMLWIKAEYVPLLYNIDNNNKKKEYYLTDIVKIMVKEGLDIGFIKANIDECMGVNTQEDLKLVNDIYELNKI